MVDLESKSPVGSSRSTMAGELAKDLAIALFKMGVTLSVANRLIIHLGDGQLARKVRLSSRA